MRKALFILTLVVVFAGCTFGKQQNAIKDARIGIAAAGIATDAASKAATEYFSTFPSSNTEKYCQGEIAALILEEAVSVENLGADGVKLWETLLVVAMAKKEQGADYKFDLDMALSSEADWLKIAEDIVGVLDFAMREIGHAGYDVPSLVKYAYKWLWSITGKPERVPYEMDWGDFKNGVCKDFIPGGAP